MMAENRIQQTLGKSYVILMSAQLGCTEQTVFSQGNRVSSKKK